MGRIMRLLSALLVVSFTFNSLFPAGLVAWKLDLENPIRFQKVLDENLILVGTDRHLFAVRMQTGEVAWRFRNLQVEADDTLAVDSSVLLANEGWGGQYKDSESSVLAIDPAGGERLWESPTLKERVLSVVPDLDRNRLLLISAKDPHGKGGGHFEREPRLSMLDTSTGKIVWRSDFGRDVRLSPVFPPEKREKEGEKENEKPYLTFNLAAYHPPLFHGDKLFLLYDGIRCYRASDGHLLWQKKFDVFEGDLSKSYAEPVFDQENVYLAGEGAVRAFRLADGKQVWKTDDFGVVTELSSDDKVIYGKLGGQFYDFEDNEWDLKGPYGVVALNRANGKKLWKWDNGDDGITNLLIFGDRVYFADSDSVIALDRTRGKRVYKAPHHFARNPRFIALNEAGHLVLNGDEDAGSFDYAEGRRIWAHHLEPPGVGFWKRLGVVFLATTGAVVTAGSYAVAMNQGLLPAVPSQVSRIFNYKNALIRMGKGAGKGLLGASGNLLQITRYAQLDGSHQYFFTKLPQGGKGLLGVNLTTGALDQSLPLQENNVELLVSESQGRVFQADGSHLVAYELQDAAR